MSGLKEREWAMWQWGITIKLGGYNLNVKSFPANHPQISQLKNHIKIRKQKMIYLVEPHCEVGQRYPKIWPRSIFRAWKGDPSLDTNLKICTSKQSPSRFGPAYY